MVCNKERHPVYGRRLVVSSNMRSRPDRSSTKPPRRTPWKPPPGTTDRIEEFADTPEHSLGSVVPPDITPERMSKLDALINRLPPVLAQTQRLRLEGLTQAAIGQIMNVSQTTVFARLKVATRRMQALVLIPEWSAEEVADILIKAREKTSVVEAARHYWTHELTTGHATIAQTTLWQILFSQQRKGRGRAGFCIRKGKEKGVVGDVARALLIRRGLRRECWIAVGRHKGPPR